MAHQLPTLQDLQDAHNEYTKIMRGDFAYRGATELINFGFDKPNPHILALGVVILLRDWNKGYYRFKHHDALDDSHLASIEQFVRNHLQTFRSFRERSIENFTEIDNATIQRTFEAFHPIVGSVGAAKALHILAPRYFPPWDAAIASKYGCSLTQDKNKKAVKDAVKYCIFIDKVRQEFNELGGEQVLGSNPLKSIDEYNWVNSLQFMNAQKKKADQQINGNRVS